MAATEHWITDIYTVHATGAHGNNMSTNHQSVFYLFHLLRLMGWKLIAECDYPSITPHITDGSMEALNVTSWTAVGTATRAKSTSSYHDGSQSLTFVTLANGDGVQSANFALMTASKPFRLSFWIFNNCGHALTCYVDTGNGSWVSLGTMASNGAWARYEWGYTSHTSVSAVRFKVVDVVGTVSAGQVYLDTCYTSISYYEQCINGSGSDGIIEASNNTFSSTSYAFTSDDVTFARKLVIYDPTNQGNSGVYTVVGLSGSKAVVELRAVGTYYLTAATGIAFRILTPTTPGTLGVDGGSVFHSEYEGNFFGAGNGFILESPHSSAWRLKVRYLWSWAGGLVQVKPYVRWASSPGACEIDVETFKFFKKQRSTQRNLMPDASYAVSVIDAHGSRAAETVASGDGRFSALIDGAGKYILLLFRTTAGYHDAALVGFLGDAYFPEDETFVHIQGGGSETPGNALVFSNATTSWMYSGCSFESDGLAMRTSIGSTGYGDGAACPEAMTNAKANPYSGEEYVRPLFMFCDWPGVNGRFRIIESQLQTIGHCRQNLTTFAPFGASLEWFHAISGLCFKWHGRQVIV